MLGIVFFTISPILYRSVQMYKSSEPSISDVIDRVSKRYLSDHKEEAARLLQDPDIKNLLQKNNLLDKVAVIGRILELQKELEPRCYVFTHGTNLNFAFFTRVYKVAMEVFEEKKTSGEVLRPKFLHNPDREPSWYAKRISCSHTDANYGNEIISADSNLLNTVYSESAISFAFLGCRSMRGTIGPFTDSNLNQDQASGKDLIQCIANHYCPNQALEIEQQLITAQALTNESDFGEIYAIVVPKNSFDKVGYLSAAFGVSAKGDSNEGKTPEELLVAMQKGEKRRVSNFSSQELQVRLIPGKFEESGVEVRGFSFPNQQKTLSEAETEIRTIFKRALSTSKCNT